MLKYFEASFRTENQFVKHESLTILPRSFRCLQTRYNSCSAKRPAESPQHDPNGDEWSTCGWSWPQQELFSSHQKKQVLDLWVSSSHDTRNSTLIHLYKNPGDCKSRHCGVPCIASAKTWAGRCQSWVLWVPSKSLRKWIKSGWNPPSPSSRPMAVANSADCLAELAVAARSHGCSCLGRSDSIEVTQNGCFQKEFQNWTWAIQWFRSIRCSNR